MAIFAPSLMCMNLGKWKNSLRSWITMWNSTTWILWMAISVKIWHLHRVRSRIFGNTQIHPDCRQRWPFQSGSRSGHCLQGDGARAEGELRSLEDFRKTAREREWVPPCGGVREFSERFVRPGSSRRRHCSRPFRAEFADRVRISRVCKMPENLRCRRRGNPFFFPWRPF